MSDELPRAVAVVGANASGKSALGIDLAAALGGEIVSADSRQVYRGFDLCSGKVTVEERAAVPHHLIDVVDPPDAFSLHDYLALARDAMDRIASAGRVPVLVGGTPLYAEAVVRGYSLAAPSPDPEERAALEARSVSDLAGELDRLFPGEAARVGPTNQRRLVRAVERARRGVSYDDAHTHVPTHRWLIFGVTWPLPELERRIRRRLEDRLAAGMVAEIEDALERGAPRSFLWSLGLEYRQCLRRLDGEFADDAAFADSLARDIRRFAKRQLAWFRRWPDIAWLEGTHEERLAAALERAGEWLAVSDRSEG